MNVGQMKIPSGKLTQPMKIPIFPGKYHQNGGFSMAMFVYQRVGQKDIRDFCAKVAKGQL